MPTAAVAAERAKLTLAAEGAKFTLGIVKF
jgi:hypothetical protein